VRISQSLAERLRASDSPAFPGTESMWRARVNKAIKDAGVKTTPHGFRHYRITEWLSAGVHVDDVADMVGTSSKDRKPKKLRYSDQYQSDTIRSPRVMKGDSP
jgi:integrase